MRFVSIVFILFLSLHISAQENSSPSIQAVQKIQDGLDKIPQSTNPNKDCYFCELTLSGSSKIEGNVDICEDFYNAICLQKNGEPKFKKDEIESYLQEIVRYARGLTAQKLGYKNYEDMVAKGLAEFGLSLDTTSQPEEYAKFLNGNTFDRSLLKEISVCKKEDKDNATYEVKKKFATKYQAKIENLYTANIAAFYNDYITDFCEDLPDKIKGEKDKSEKLSPNLLTKAEQGCKNKIKLKQEAIRISRLEGTAEYKKAAENFITANTHWEIKFSERGKAPNQSFTDLNTCNTFGKATQEAARAILKKVNKETSNARPTIDYLMRFYYSDSQKQKFSPLFDRYRGKIKRIMGTMIKDSGKRARIQSKLDGISMGWFKPPTNTDYAGKGRNRVEKLDVEDDGFIDSINEIFNDPDLKFFTEANANFIPNLIYGETKTNSRVMMMPAFLQMYHSSAPAYIAVLAHEFGHQVDPDVSRLEKIDLTEEYKDLLECYKSRDSIHMHDSQKGEVIGDFMASEILAEELETMPQESRLQAAKAAIEVDCYFDASTENIDLDTEAHPLSQFRINGVFGANPRLRNALGCTARSKDYKNCGLK